MTTQASAATAQDTTQAAAATTSTETVTTPAPESKEGDGKKVVTPPEVVAAKSDKPTEIPAENKTVVPEKYELKIPEGSKLEASAVEKVSAYAKEKGLTNEQAQELLNRDHAAVTAYAEQANNQLKSLNETTWKNELANDKEFGGDKFEANGHLAFRAAAKWFGEDFANDLKAMNLNHHPKLFRGLVKLGNAMADDKAVLPGNGAGETRNIEEVFYGKQKQ